MRSLAAGPVTVHTIDPLESVLTIAAFGVWIDRLGYVTASDSGSTTPNNLYAVELDGAGIRIGGRRNPAGLGWSPAVGTPRPAIVWSGLGPWHELELPSTAVVGPEVSSVFLPGTFGVMADRVIAATGNHVSAYPKTGGSTTTEYTFAAIPGSASLTHIAYAGQVGGNHRWWCGAASTGFLCLYDATAQTEVLGKRTTLGAAFRSFGYSVKHDLFIAVRRPASVDEISVYTNETLATSITVPTFAAPVLRGQVVPASSLVLGAAGEPAVARNVRFTATTGRFDPEVTATGADGRALSTYHAAFTAGTDPITAELAE